ncbi:MAG TPA: hypothetical protein QGF58_16765 [Myxococcota bacterium]|nr:hypothetical protein [Myxococcota bacterium]
MEDIKVLYEDRVTRIGDICQKYCISRYRISKMAKEGEWIKGDYVMKLKQVDPQLDDIKIKYEDSETSMKKICEEYALNMRELREMAHDCEWVKGVRTKKKYYVPVKLDRRKRKRVWTYINMTCLHLYNVDKEDKFGNVCPVCREEGMIHEMKISDKIY